MRPLLSRTMTVSAVCTAFIFACFLVFNTIYDTALQDAQYFNGWLLVAAMATMLLLTIRKKTVILPLGRTRHWLQLHYYMGWLVLGIFLVHTGFRIPDTPLEMLLWFLFCLIALSGIVGGLLSSILPQRLEGRGPRVLFETIPAERGKLADKAEALALDSLQSGRAHSLSELYVDRLSAFFAGPRNFLAHIRSSKLPLVRLLGELDSTGRYLDTDGKARLEEMKELAALKYDLDYHHANGCLLKYWLFFHTPTTYALLIFLLSHVAIAYGFTSGAP